MDLHQLIELNHLEEVEDNKYDLLDIYFNADNEVYYNKVTKLLDSIFIEEDNYRLFTWYDTSGYDYWSKQRDKNYCCITIELKDSITDNDIDALHILITSTVETIEECVYQDYPIIEGVNSTC